MFFKHIKWALLWAIFIFVLCAVPGKDVPSVTIPNFDKYVHAGLFFILILLAVRGFKLQTTFSFMHNSPKLTAFIKCAAYGGIIEIMQGAFFNERSADFLDFIADSLGCLAGILIYNWTENNILKKLIY